MFHMLQPPGTWVPVCARHWVWHLHLCTFAFNGLAWMTPRNCFESSMELGANKWFKPCIGNGVFMMGLYAFVIFWDDNSFMIFDKEIDVWSRGLKTKI